MGSSSWDAAFSELGTEGRVLMKILEPAYDSARFKGYANIAKSENHWNREASANAVIWEVAAKMTAQGGGLGIFGGLSAVVAGGTDITSLLYHIVEMCGVLAEIYGQDTSDDGVKVLVLAGASGDTRLISTAKSKLTELLFDGAARDVALKPLVKTLLVPILKALGLKVGVRGGIKLAELIPVVGAVVGGGTNCWMINDTGHRFLSELQKKSS